MDGKIPEKQEEKMELKIEGFRIRAIGDNGDVYMLSFTAEGLDGICFTDHNSRRKFEEKLETFVEQNLFCDAEVVPIVCED
jgi:hypothetical protein